MEKRYKVEFICENPVTEQGYYQLVRLSDDAILAAKENYRAMVDELDERMIAGLTEWL